MKGLYQQPVRLLVIGILQKCLMGVHYMHKMTIYIFAFLATAGTGANAMFEVQQDPLNRINYRDAFDQTKITGQFRGLMERWGCAANVFGQTDASIDIAEIFSEQDIVADQDMLDYEESDYAQACLNQLHIARRWTITEPAREALTFMALEAIAAGILMKTLKADSLGGSFSVFAALFNSVHLLNSAVRSLYTLAYPPAHPLCILEELFAKNQCFIPKALWPMIIEKFMLARLNQFEQRKSIDYIEFALGLTIYKPKPSVRLKNNIGLEEGMGYLFENIDKFFEDYVDQKDNQTSLWILKHNVYKFVKALRGDVVGEVESPRYLYLHGPGGIGKTHFIHQLCAWINELIPGSIHFEEVTVSTPDELEGNQERPGVFLRVFRNQLMNDKKGSVIFIDEATWLNNEGMVSPAKRVFNGNQSRLSTTYFGAGVDGTGVAIKAPPMLIFVACNETIRDIPLQSRFDCIQFPMPKMQTLVQHALKTCEKNALLQELGISLSAFAIATWIQETALDNFRDIAAKIIPFALRTYEEKIS